MTGLLEQPLPLRVWLGSKRKALNERLETAQARGQELAVKLEIKSADGKKPAGPHDLLKHFIAAEVRMRQLLLSHPAPLLIVNQEGRLLLTNVAAKQLLAALGYSFKQAQPQYPSLDEVFPNLEADVELCLQVNPSYAPSGEVVFLAKGTWIQWQNTPARILLFHDVSVEHQARQKLQDAVASLEELNRLKSEFLSMATHEFRTPLSSIYSSLQLMEQYCQKMQADAVDSPWLGKLQKHLKRSEEAIQQLDGLVQEILVLEKNRGGHTRFEPYAVRVTEVVEEVLERLKPIAEKMQLELVYQPELTSPEQNYLLDPQLLQPILSNLVSNALKFSPPAAQVEVRVTLAGTWLCFEVTDQGRGIPSEDLAKLGEPFFRAANVDNVQGTGLGLSIVQHFIALHQGHLEVDSQLGKGSQFRVWLPAQLPQQEVDHE